LETLLSGWHLERLHNPWQPFKQYGASKNTRTGAGSITVPGTSATFEVDDDLSSLAEKLAQKADISLNNSLVICKSYELHSLDDDRSIADDGRLARVLAWWSEETLAVAEITVTLLLLGSGTGNQDWSELGAGLRELIMVDPEQMIESLFKAFSHLAQKPLDGQRRSEYPLFW
jgi:nuclear pore complex protein Nup188